MHTPIRLEGHKVNLKGQEVEKPFGSILPIVRTVISHISCWNQAPNYDRDRASLMADSLTTRVSVALVDPTLVSD